MNETFLAVVDEARGKYGLSRSEFLRQAVMSRMRELNEMGGQK